MKKLFSVLAVVVLAAAMLAGCEETTTSEPAQTDSTVVSSEQADDIVSVDASKYEKSFDGFVEYLTDSGYIEGDGSELSADAIGAEKGLRYMMGSTTSRHYVEVYCFGDELSETAVSTIEMAQNENKFALFGDEAATQSTFAVATTDGKYLLLYTAAPNDEVQEELKKTLSVF